MKLRNHQFSTQPQIFSDGNYTHPWYKYVDKLIRPNPPTQQAVDKAKFVDKTYKWSRDDSVRPRIKRSTK